MRTMVAATAVATILPDVQGLVSLRRPRDYVHRLTHSNTQSSRRRLPITEFTCHDLPPTIQARRRCDHCTLHSSEYDDAEFYDEYEMEEEEETERNFLQRELSHVESLEELLEELESDGSLNETEYYDDDGRLIIDDNDVDDLFELLKDAQFEGIDAGEDGRSTSNEDNPDLFSKLEEVPVLSAPQPTMMDSVLPAETLEDALLQGVVPADAGVGSERLPGDYGFDPLNLATKDYILQIQTYLLRLLPGGDEEEPHVGTGSPEEARPTALILRDYREAEIRHSRLAMLAAVFWPLQEMLDRLILDEDQFGPILYGPVTLPYFPLLMTLIMMLLGYLDIYAKAIKDRDEIGDAFLPGDCFWDPLRILEGAPARMKRNMQERELFNGRVAMLAIAAFIFEEGTTHLPLISIEGNDLLLEPAYQVPFIQEWLDTQFADMVYR